MDIGTGLALFGTAKLVERLLGPTADYIGEGIGRCTEKQIENLRLIFAKAINKAAPELDEEGAVPPKVLKGILAEGPFCDDRLSAEYFGGALASSRSKILRDDRAAAIIALLSRLSCYQIRSHYIFYTVIKKLFDGQHQNFGPDDRARMVTYIPFFSYRKAMGFEADETRLFSSILGHVMFGLKQEGLIGQLFYYGGTEHLRRSWPDAPSNGMLLVPSVLGVQLYLAAHGCADFRAKRFFEPSTTFEIEEDVSIPEGYLAVNLISDEIFSLRSVEDP